MTKQQTRRQIHMEIMARFRADLKKRQERMDADPVYRAEQELKERRNQAERDERRLSYLERVSGEQNAFLRSFRKEHGDMRFRG